MNKLIISITFTDFTDYRQHLQFTRTAPPCKDNFMSGCSECVKGACCVFLFLLPLSGQKNRLEWSTVTEDNSINHLHL